MTANQKIIDLVERLNRAREFDGIAERENVEDWIAWIGFGDTTIATLRAQVEEREFLAYGEERGHQP